MPKISIVNVDLRIPDLIREDVSALTDDTKRILDNSISAIKASQAKANERSAAREAAERQMTAILDQIYEGLLRAGQRGIAATDIMSQVMPLIKTGSAFTLRMKTYLRLRGNEYILDRRTLKGTAFYFLTAFNAVDSAAG